MEKKNRLEGESSLYLRQHAQNPVHWFPWADLPFQIAQEEDKPLLVSIGYAACHWCHVMESESFEDQEVAAFMNAHFICIKVDREELPDVDQFYMDAALAITGSGGWPLNVFVNADRQPFFAGTYFPPQPLRSMPSWLEVLKGIQDIWVHQREDMAMQAAQLTRVIQGAQESETPKEPQDSASWAKEISSAVMKGADRENGGFGRAPKFPSAIPIRWLIEASVIQGEESYWDHAVLSLEGMIRGGIYDQVGGGLCRYATDEAWGVPHFEKMLYDNAQLVEVLCLAYKKDPRPHWARVIRETIEWVESDLRSPGGGYDSALDADSEGVEGKFYVWTADAFRSCLSDPPPWLESYFGITDKGNGEGTNILTAPRSPLAFAAEHGLDPVRMEEAVSWARLALKAERNKRVPPARDDKQILSWNALWNLALTKAGSVLGDPVYLDRAEQHMGWILDRYFINGSWVRIQGKNGPRIQANLGDYASLISAMLSLASWRKKEVYLPRTSALLEKVIEEFCGDTQPFFPFVQKDHQRVPIVRIDREDLTMPSSNALMAENLILAGMIFSRSSYLDRAESMLAAMNSLTMRYPHTYGYWALLIQRQYLGWKKLSLSGKESQNWHGQLSKEFWPQVYLEGVENEREREDSLAETQIQVCQSRHCYPPVSDLKVAISLING